MRLLLREEGCSFVHFIHPRKFFREDDLIGGNKGFGDDHHFGETPFLYWLFLLCFFLLLNMW